MKKTVKSVVDAALCCGCGACVGVCPTNAISMKINCAGFLVSVINDDQCINCGKCLSVCTGKSENDTINEKDFIGDILHGYIGHATSNWLRNCGQSGGGG